MNLTVVVLAAHNPEMTERARLFAESNATHPQTRVVVFDNGVGEGELGTGENVGNYPVFRELAESDLGFVLLIHNDLYIYERGYDRRILDAFREDDRLGLVGFVGSGAYCFSGGRGGGVWMNFQGVDERGSHYSVHGGDGYSGFRPAAVLDGCALAFRTEALRDVGHRPDFPPHHFYDRLLCCQMLEAGWHVGYLGVACDHLNGQTANVYAGYKSLAEQWVAEHRCTRTGQPDHDVYLEAEHQFLSEYRDAKRFIPLRVGPDHTIYHTHPERGRA